MKHVPVRQRRRVGPWVQGGLLALVWMTWGGTAHGQSIEQAQEMNQNTEFYLQLFRWFGTGIFVLGIIGAIGLVTMVVLRVYLRSSATTDPLKLAMSDPWVRAHLDQWQAAAAGSAPAEGAVATQPEPSPAEPADVPADPGPASITNR